jgi:hypothetical protein
MTTVQVNPPGFLANTRLITVQVQWCDDIGALHQVTVSGIRANNNF